MKPIMWAFTGSRDTGASVAAVLNSGRVNLLAIFAGNRTTSDTLDDAVTVGAIKMARKANVPIILFRYLWETQASAQATMAAARTAATYVDEIRLTRQEAASRSIGYTGLVTEPYGETELNTVFDSATFPKDHADRIADAVAEAVKRGAVVDCVFPAGSARANHPYLSLSALGRLRIADGTYYNRPANIAAIAYPYEIAGMYVTANPATAAANDLYLPSEVFYSRRDVWLERGGLFIWPEENEALAVAQAIASLPS